VRERKKERKKDRKKERKKERTKVTDGIDVGTVVIEVAFANIHCDLNRGAMSDAVQLNQTAIVPRLWEMTF